MDKVREIFFSNEFEEFLRNQKFVKKLENTEFYELRVSVSSNEYRIVFFAIDHSNFMQCHKVLLLNAFLKKGAKQYRAEIKVAENMLKKYTEE